MKRKSGQKIIFIFLFIWITFWATNAIAQHTKEKKNAMQESYVETIDINISQELESFNSPVADARYSISLCADVPNNKKPYKVAYQQQTGHVFLILQQLDPAGDTLSQVFGFYPKKGLPTLFFKTIKSVIKDNSKRDYDASITKELSRSEFDTILSKSISYSKNIYHINRFNCYEYAVFIFNSVAGKDTLPVNHVRFPFIFGRGGSPAGLYLDLEKMKSDGSPWASSISFGKFVAPKSSTRILPGKKKKRNSRN